jgi:hypothetical protein
VRQRRFVERPPLKPCARHLAIELLDRDARRRRRTDGDVAHLEVDDHHATGRREGRHDLLEVGLA